MIYEDYNSTWNIHKQMFVLAFFSIYFNSCIKVYSIEK